MSKSLLSVGGGHAVKSQSLCGRHSNTPGSGGSLFGMSGSLNSDSKENGGPEEL
jgi:hypothetical protein